MTRTLHYDDLALAIERDRDGGWEARVLASPLGPAAAPLDLSALSATLREALGEDDGLALLLAASSPARCVARVGQGSRKALAVRKAGGVLFRARVLVRPPAELRAAAGIEKDLLEEGQQAEVMGAAVRQLGRPPCAGLDRLDLA